ncbi:hypothetical protein [Mycobacterium sp. Marseille-P9652]|nr:hypothetical protein [Mycobacterium sp. Marseille-P9652]
MCPSRRCVRLAAPLALIAVAAAVVWSRRGIEVWHVAVDEPPAHDEGP